MASMHTTTPISTALSNGRGIPRRLGGADPRLLIAGALFLAALIAEATFIALAGPTIAEIGSLYITVT